MAGDAGMFILNPSKVCSKWYTFNRSHRWPLLMTLAVDRLQILDDVSNFIQTRMRDRLRLTTTGRFPTIIRLERLKGSNRPSLVGV